MSLFGMEWTKNGFMPVENIKKPEKTLTVEFVENRWEELIKQKITPWILDMDLPRKIGKTSVLEKLYAKTGGLFITKFRNSQEVVEKSDFILYNTSDEYKIISKLNKGPKYIFVDEVRDPTLQKLLRLSYNTTKIVMLGSK